MKNSKGKKITEKEFAEKDMRVEVPINYKKKWIEENREHLKEYYRDYNKTRTYNDKYSKKWKSENKEKVFAQIELRKAVKDKIIKRLPCEVCGNIKSQGHHPDYTEPLKVKWLCVLHHRELHNKLKQMPLKIKESKKSQDWEAKFYKIWENMKTRCNYKSHSSYKNYGGRGIKIEWKDFMSFKNDMYDSYLKSIKENPKISIDRINNDGNYCKKNCRWANSYQQHVNRRTTPTIPIFELERIFGVCHNRIRYWVKKVGMKEAVNKAFIGIINKKLLSQRTKIEEEILKAGNDNYVRMGGVSKWMETGIKYGYDKFWRTKIVEECMNCLPEEGIEWMQEGSHHKDKKGYTNGFNSCLLQFKQNLNKLKNEKK